MLPNPKAPILVIGDTMLDVYLWSDVHRISPEAPVPVARIRSKTESLGGAANTAHNLAELGGDVILFGVIGEDQEASTIQGLLHKAKIQSQMFVQPQRATTTKTRVMGQSQHLLRIDQEDASEIDDEVSAKILNAAQKILSKQKISAVVLSDYQKGVLSAPFCQAVIGLAKAKNIPVVVDPKGQDFTKYQGATILTPNSAELKLATKLDNPDINNLLAAGQDMVAQLHFDAILLTRGAQGMSLIRTKGDQHIAAIPRAVFDVSGAGDTVVAAIALGLAGGWDLLHAARVANVAASLVVGKVGTVPVQRDELLAALVQNAVTFSGDKMVTLDTLRERVTRWQSSGQRVVFTNGCFDLLHAGHIALLEQARRLGERLVVGLNADASIQRLKGPSRPILPESDRMKILSAFGVVDAVILFEDDTPLELIKALRPDVLVKGSDYAADAVVGAAEVTSWGGRVELIPIKEGRSTTNLVQKIQGKMI